MIDNDRVEKIRPAIRRAVKLIASGKLKVPEADRWKLAAALAYEQLEDVTVGELEAAITAEGEMTRAVCLSLGLDVPREP